MEPPSYRFTSTPLHCSCTRLLAPFHVLYFLQSVGMCFLELDFFSRVMPDNFTSSLSSSCTSPMCIQTGMYVVRAEDLPLANKPSCPQRPIKRAEFEKVRLKKCHFIWGRQCGGGFSKRANLTGKISSARRKQTFQSGCAY